MVVRVAAWVCSPVAGHDPLAHKLQIRSCLLVPTDGRVGDVVVMTKLLECGAASTNLLQGVEWAPEEDSAAVVAGANIRLSDDQRHLSRLLLNIYLVVCGLVESCWGRLKTHQGQQAGAVALLLAGKLIMQSA